MDFRRIALKAMLMPLLFGFVPSPAHAILIDGHVNEWEGVKALPIPAESSTYSSTLGKIDEMKVSQDDDFIYVYLKFAEPRPFKPSSHQSELVSGVWDDFSYLEIDRDGDGQWDYLTRMVKGKRIGVNNLAILRRIPGTDAGQILLAAEGRKDYQALGPRAFFSEDAKAVELRIPRLPLRLQKGNVFVRAMTHYRDDRAGKSPWVTRYFPSNDGWIAMELRTIQRRGAGSQSNSPARLREPVIPRRDFEDEVGPRYARYPTAYTYPWREIGPSKEVSSRSPDALPPGTGTPSDSASSPTRNLIVVTPDGQVRTGAPGTSSDDPEEGQGVPLEVESDLNADGSRDELHE